MKAARQPEPPWMRNIRARESDARFSLFMLLRRCHRRVPLEEICAWSGEQRDRAYEWARAFSLGQEDLPPPPHVFDADPWRA